MSLTHLPALLVDEDVTVIDPDVAAAYAKWQHDLGNEQALDDLIALADARDQPLCHVWSTGCWTPLGLTRLRCCGTYVCPEHHDAHDDTPAAGGCREFDALLWEESYR
jgi:hypothetical protein